MCITTMPAAAGFSKVEKMRFDLSQTVSLSGRVFRFKIKHCRHGHYSGLRILSRDICPTPESDARHDRLNNAQFIPFGHDFCTVQAA